LQDVRAISRNARCSRRWTIVAESDENRIGANFLLKSRAKKIDGPPVGF
jgi:hypothetical protein